MTRAAIALAVLLSPLAAHAQGNDAVQFKITSGGKDLYKLAAPRPLGDAASSAECSAVLNNDLALSSFFKVIDEKAFLANLAAEQLTINAVDWRNVGAEGVVKTRVTASGDRLLLEARIYEVTKGDQPVLSKEYRGGMQERRHLCHQLAADVVKYFTGEESFFSSRVTFAASTSPSRKDVYVMDWDGFGVSAVTRSSQNILPSWAPSGREVLFTSYMAGQPDLYAMPIGGRPRVVSNRSGLNSGGVYSPDGSKIALTLSQDGNPEIYVLTAAGGILKRLTNNNFIDTSPTWSPDGSRIAFVSNRYGSPQIWTMNADGSNQQRLTRRGNYNQTPAWCPRKELPLLAFTARDEAGSYDIFTINVDSGELVRVTEGHGSNQHPSWAPNGRAVVYESSRGGIWVSTADGRTERQVWKGGATAPAWGPAAK